MNQEKYEERLTLVKQIFHRFDLEPSEISPVDYDENLPFPYNNFIYKVSLSEPAFRDAFTNAGPYTTKLLSESVSDFIIRLSNPAAEGLNHDNRVENEVGSMYLARQGLASFEPQIAFAIPSVYAWQAQTKFGDANETFGWTIMEFKQGEPLDKVFPLLDSSKKKDVLGQIADIFSSIQRATLPASLDSYGGITIKDGKLVHGQMTTLPGGPWKSYGNFWTTRLSSQLNESNQSPALQGWNPNGVRERIDRFLAADIDNVMEAAGVDITRRSLVLGDLSEFSYSSICTIT
ncbi:phosphotransferase enzyme family protein [Phlyctema vagabunda]|uniref:Phosphotransferase enzyme family protein n=1 Tax=Phlyctema vagabunda TaxID=108571 RepID=A0ABR4P381_9HELO